MNAYIKLNLQFILNSHLILKLFSEREVPMTETITTTLVRNLHDEIKTVIDRIAEENNCFGVGAPTPEQIDKNLEIIGKLEKQMNQLQSLYQLN